MGDSADGQVSKLLSARAPLLRQGGEGECAGCVCVGLSPAEGQIIHGGPGSARGEVSLEMRAERRRERSAAIAGEIKARLESKPGVVLPQSRMGKGVRNVLGQWNRLERFLEYPGIELSNSLAENKCSRQLWGGRIGPTARAWMRAERCGDPVGDGELPEDGDAGAGVS